MKYFEELKRSMEFLGKKNNTIFIGQAVEVPGTAMSNTLKNIKKNKLLELPVAEEMQMGMTLGLAMDDNIPISIFPRWNFLLYGMNQLVNHIDKFKVMTGSAKIPKLVSELVLVLKDLYILSISILEIQAQFKKCVHL